MLPLPDKRLHRGPHPADSTLFAAEQRPKLRQAAGDLCWLLSRGYAQPSALKLVGDRYQLAERQRMALLRSTCSDQQRSRRLASQVPWQAPAGRTLWIDGYNVLTTIEAALAGGFLLAGRDGCYRDLASVHGTFRRVEETSPALELLGEMLAPMAGPIVWYFDSPVSNSGRLRGLMLALAGRRQWKWQVELVTNPDVVLAASPQLIATADSAILDRAAGWLNLARLCVERNVPQANVVDFGDVDAVTTQC
jgi:hypothetical protein